MVFFLHQQHGSGDLCMAKKCHNILQMPNFLFLLKFPPCRRKAFYEVILTCAVRCGVLAADIVDVPCNTCGCLVFSLFFLGLAVALTILLIFSESAFLFYFWKR